MTLGISMNLEAMERNSAQAVTLLKAMANERRYIFFVCCTRLSCRLGSFVGS